MTKALVDSAFDKLEKCARSFRDNRPAIGPGNPIEFPEAASIGDGIWQGDLGFVLAAGIEEGFTKPEKPVTKLVPGTTKGSQHLLEGHESVEVYLPPTWGNEEALIGPRLVVNKKVGIAHPQHGTVTLQPGTTVQCIYQLNWDISEKIARRARD